jgi:hypothetical protein
MNIERAFIIKHPHVPEKLYKYRQFTANHIDALTKGVLWMSSPDRFNDPYEAAVHFDPDRLLVENRSVEDTIEVAEELDSIVKAGGTWQPKKLVHPIQLGEWRRKNTAELLRDFAIPDKDALAKAAEECFKKGADDSVKRMSDRFRQGFSAISLSENCSSTLMWSSSIPSFSGVAFSYVVS